VTNPEIVEKWRTEFESEFEENMLKRNSAGGYINSHVNSMWDGFLMRCQSVEKKCCKGGPHSGHEYSCHYAFEF
jgi:ribosomal protein S17E